MKYLRRGLFAIKVIILGKMPDPCREYFTMPSQSSKFYSIETNEILHVDIIYKYTLKNRTSTIEKLKTYVELCLKNTVDVLLLTFFGQWLV